MMANVWMTIPKENPMEHSENHYSWDHKMKGIFKTMQFHFFKNTGLLPFKDAKHSLPLVSLSRTQH